MPGVNCSHNLSPEILKNILGIKTIHGEKLYLIKWVGQSVQQASWEKEHNLRGFEELIKLFEEKYYLPYL